MNLGWILYRLVVACILVSSGNYMVSWVMVLILSREYKDKLGMEKISLGEIISFLIFLILFIVSFCVLFSDYLVMYGVGSIKRFIID